MHDFKLPYVLEQPEADGSQVAMQRSFSGEFVIAEPQPGTWQIDNRIAPYDKILVRGVQTPRSAVPVLPTAVSLVWTTGERVALTLTDAVGSVTVACDTALSHETAPALYRILPLAQFTADRQRFWRRVFWLVRIPGGRLLLRLIAKRERRSGRTEN